MKEKPFNFAIVLSVLVFASCSSGSDGAACDPLRDALCAVENASDSSTNSRRDATVTSQRDATVTSQRDATVSSQRDATVTSQPDGSVSQPDGSVSQPDGSVSQPDGGACGRIEPKPTGPAACTDATRSCIEACGDSTCVGSCLQATAGCFECFQAVGEFCEARNGCETETRDILCCLEQDCAGAQDIPACVQAMCPSAGNAYQTCVNTNAVTAACLNVFSAEYAVCFEDAPDASVPDASVPDGGVRECAIPLSPVPDNVHAFCEGTTRTCIASATTELEYDNCLAADAAAPYVSGTTTLDCDWCIGYSRSSCGSNNGCGNEFGEFFCCAEDNSCTDATCTTANCGSEGTALSACFSTIANVCADINNAVYDPCF